MSNREDSVWAAERSRRDLMAAGKFSTLADMFHRDMTYTHGNGHTHDKLAYLDHISSDFSMVDIVWEDARVRCHGDMALLSGRVTSVLRPSGTDEARSFPAYATLVWVFVDERWQLLSYQGTRLAA
jgi:hypothetical protein